MKLKWQQAPVKTQWGDEMVVASVAIDKDHTLSLYCERDQTPKVEAMFAKPAQTDLEAVAADQAMTIALLRAEQPAQQEPVFWAISYDGKTPYALWPDGDGALFDLEIRRQGGTASKMPLYTSPPAQRTWVGLTDEEKRQIFEREDYQGWLDYINAIEAKLKEKNA